MPEDLNSLLNAYLDGRLSDAQRTKVEARLKLPSVARRFERLKSLRSELRAALPQPSPEQSLRLWSAIHGRLSAELRSGSEAPTPSLSSQLPLGKPVAEALTGTPLQPVSGPWHSFFTRPWMPSAWGVGLAGAAALAWIFWLHPRALPRGAVSSPVVMGSAPANIPHAPGGLGIPAVTAKRAAGPSLLAFHKHSGHSGNAKREVLPAPAPLLADATTGTAGFSPPATTEVEQALANNQVDDMIDQFLTVRQQAAASVVAGMAPSPEIQPGGGGGGGADVSYQQAPVPVVQDDASSSPVRAQGGKDSNGFWNWNPAALALNQRNWPQARVELRAALGNAGEAAERAFANSALSLLSAPGGPLEGSQPILPPVGDLRVLSAGTWQLLVESRLARFGGGVSVGLPGLREDGDSFLLDLTFDRGEFAPGAHFVRVSGETPVRVLDAVKQPVSSNDFYAPSGADYDIADHELRLR